MEALTALVAALLGRLHGVTADAVCPGGWPWAVSLLGVAVGLVPAAGAVHPLEDVIAVLSRRAQGTDRTIGKIVFTADDAAPLS